MIQLNSQDFNVSRPMHSAIYSSFTGDLSIVGKKGAKESIVFTFNVENNPPFANGQSLSMAVESDNEILYYTAQRKKYSSHNLEGFGTFNVQQYIEGDIRNHLSGTVSGVLYNEEDSTSVEISGFVASNTY